MAIGDLCDVCKSGGRIVRVSKGEFEGYLLCSKHRTQVSRHGKILERTRFDKNEFISKDGYLEIVCYDRYGIETGRGSIDFEDYEKIKDYKWRYMASENGRLVTDIGKKTAKMHLFILDRIGVNDGMMVDHIDRDASNNRRNNLRIVTNKDNSYNSGLSVRNNSGYTGVGYNKRDNCWKAYIKAGDTTKSKSGFKDMSCAIKQRLRWEYELFGSELAPQRHLFKEYGIGSEA